MKLDVASIVSMVQQDGGYMHGDTPLVSAKKTVAEPNAKRHVREPNDKIAVREPSRNRRHRHDAVSKLTADTSSVATSQDVCSVAMSQDGRSMATSQDGRSVAMSQDGRSMVSVSSHTSDCCSKCGSNLPAGPNESRLSSRASSVLSYKRPGVPPPKLGVSAVNANRRVHAAAGSTSVSLRTPSSASHVNGSRVSLTSSALSMINDCDLILGSIDRGDRTVQQQLRHQHGARKTTKRTLPKTKLEQAVAAMEKQGNLGYTAGQVSRR